jgi:hypothetical protein
MPKFGLTTFAKIIQFTPERKIKEYSEYLKPGGFDYYRTLNESIAMATWENRCFNEAIEHLNSIPNIARRKNCLTAFNDFKKVFMKSGSSFLKPPEAEIVSPKGYLIIKIKPTAHIVSEDKNQLILIWPNKTFKLEPRGSSCVADLMIKHLQTKNPISEYVIADLPHKNSQIVTHETRSPIASVIIDSELAFADSYFEAEEKKKKAA